MTAPFIFSPVFYRPDAPFGKLYTFSAGTTTPKVTYSDSEGTVPNSTPVSLDATGSAIVRGGAGAYDLVLKDQTDTVTLWSADDYEFPLYNQADVIGALGADPVFRQTLAEQNAGVIPSNLTFAPGCPERYLPAGVLYATASDGSGTTTDFAAAIQTALNIGGQPVILGAHLYRCESGLLVPNAQSLIGEGIYETSLCFVASLVTGTVIGWNGTNASKIQIYGFSAYCNNGASITGGMVIGTGANPVGTEGYMDQVMIRDLAAGALAFDLNCNIAEFGNLYALNSAGVRFLGNGAIQQMENTNASGFADVNGNMTCSEIQDFYVGYSEVEAPQSNNFLLTLRGQATVVNFVPSLAASTTFAELIYITSSASGWSVGIPQINYGGVNGSGGTGTRATFTGLFGDQVTDNVYGGGNPSVDTSPKGMCGYYSSGLMTQGTQFGIKKQQLNNFSLLIANNSGTLQHKITAPGQTGVAGTWTAGINADSINYTNTPTGTDATTAFAAGAKVSSADPYLLVLDTAAQVAADVILDAKLTLNSTGTGYTVRPTTVSLNINGVTQNRLAFNLVNSTSGANVNWATALGTSTWFLEVTFFGFIH